MPTAAFNKFNAFVKDCAEKKHDLSADTLKIMLTNTAPVATNSVKTDITEISAGGGYTAGGTQATLSSSAQASGTYKLVLNDVLFTGSGGGFGPFQYAVLYNDTAASDNLIGWWDYGSAVTVAAAATFNVDLSAANGVLQIT